MPEYDLWAEKLCHVFVSRYDGNRDGLSRSLLCQSPNDIVRLDTGPHALSCDVSSWFWSSDLLRRELRKLRVDMPRTTIDQEQHADVLQELRAYEIKALVGDDGEIYKYINVYPLET